MAQQLRSMATCCSRESRFSFQHPHGSLQPSITLVSGGPVTFSDLYRHCTHKKHRHTRRKNVYILENKNK